MHEFQSMDPEFGPTHSVGGLGDIWELEDPVHQGPKENLRRTSLARTPSHESQTDKANSLDSIVKESQGVWTKKTVHECSDQEGAALPVSV